MRNRWVLVLWFLVGLALPVLIAQDADPLDARLRPQIPANGVPDNVWVTDSMAKVQPDAAPGSLRFVDMSAARNEYESFQIHMRAGEAPLAVTISVSDFVNAHSPDRISSNPNVSVLREAYLNVTTVSDLNGISGLVPDALIPGTDPYFHETRNGFPLQVPPHETRSIWVDVFIPPATPSGYYLATATLNDGAKLLAKVPVRLAVWSFDLSATASLKSAFSIGYPSFGFAAYGDYKGCARYPGSNGSSERALALMHVATASFFLDHRVSISSVVVQPTIPGRKWISFDEIYGPLLDGRAPTLTAGAKLTALAYPNGKGENTADLKDYASHFAAKSWLSRFFVYQCDEPPAGCAWPTILSGANAVHAADPNIKTLVTTTIAAARKNGVLDAIDILVPVVDYMHPMKGDSQRASYDDWLKDSRKELWWYQSCDEHVSCENGTPGPKTSTWPSYMVDASPVRNRIFQWLAFSYRIQGELYYQVDMWGPDPWDHLYFAGGNGDGALYYPGTPAKIGGSTPIPVASMRLKLIRDGMEDYEYLAALAKAGQADLANQIIGSFITNAFTFKDDPAALRAAREQLGTALHRLGLARPSAARLAVNSAETPSAAAGRQ